MLAAYDFEFLIGIVLRGDECRDALMFECALTKPLFKPLLVSAYLALDGRYAGVN